MGVRFPLAVSEEQCLSVFTGYVVIIEYRVWLFLLLYTHHRTFSLLSVKSNVHEVYNWCWAILPYRFDQMGVYYL